MRFPFAFLCLVAASCAAPPESSAPAPSASASALAPVESESEHGPLESRIGDAAINFTPGEPVGEAQEALTPAVVIGIACLVAGTWAAEYGCKKHVLEDLCPPGTVITRTVHDTMDKNKTVTVRLPCDTLEIMICGTGGLTAGEIMRHMCAGIL
jgi:hypothetical protein